MAGSLLLDEVFRPDFRRFALDEIPNVKLEGPAASESPTLSVNRGRPEMLAALLRERVFLRFSDLSSCALLGFGVSTLESLL